MQFIKDNMIEFIFDFFADFIGEIASKWVYKIIGKFKRNRIS